MTNNLIFFILLYDFGTDLSCNCGETRLGGLKSDKHILEVHCARGVQQVFYD